MSDDSHELEEITQTLFKLFTKLKSLSGGAKPLDSLKGMDDRPKLILVKSGDPEDDGTEE